MTVTAGSAQHVRKKNCSRVKDEPIRLLGTVTACPLSAQSAEAKSVAVEFVVEKQNGASTIRFENRRAGVCGLVPKELSGYLAPLITSGKIRLLGKLGADGRLRIEIYLCPRGAMMLQPISAPRTQTEIIHNIVLSVCADVMDNRSSKVAREVKDRLVTLIPDDALPETRLVHSILDALAG